MALRVDARDGLVLLAAAPYDDAVVEWIRTLPKRHYRPRAQAWCVPARREQLRHVCALIGALDERDIPVDISSSASARLARVGLGRAILRDNAIEITGPYSQRRLPALRALPERRFDPKRRTWTIPLTRAGATAILDLADATHGIVTTRRARSALQRSAARTDSTPHATRSPNPTELGPKRRSPIPHWRHYTRGPIFNNPAHERANVPGIGPCVRIRVNPGRQVDPTRSSRGMSADAEHGGHV
jgi:hypothetical protein